MDDELAAFELEAFVHPAPRWREEARRATFIAGAGAREEELDAALDLLERLVGRDGAVWEVRTFLRPHDPRTLEWLQAVATHDFGWMEARLAELPEAPPARPYSMYDWVFETPDRRFLLTIGWDREA